MKETLGEKTKAGLYWNISLKAVYQIIRFGVSIIIARILDPIDFGIMAIATMFIYYSNSLSDFGFNTAIVQKDDLEPIHINSVFTLNFGISIVLTFLSILLAQPISKYFNSPESAKVMMYLSSLFLLRTFFDISSAVIRRAVEFKFIAKLTFLQNIIQSGIALSLALLGMRYWSLAWSTILSMLVATLLAVRKANWRPRFQYSHHKMKTIYNFGIWNFIRAQIYFLNKYILQFVIGRYMGPTSLGFFDKANSLAILPSEVININSVMFSSFSRIQKDKEVLGQWYSKIVTVMTIAILPVFFGLYATSRHLVIVLLGDKWSLSVQPLEILSIAIAFQMFTGLNGALNVAVGDYKRHTLRIIMITILFAILSILGRHWGIEGLCYIFLFIIVCLLVGTFTLARKNAHIPIRELLGTIFPYVLANIVMVIVVKFLSQVVLSDETLMNFVGLVVSGAICYCLLVLIINVMNGRNLLYPIFTKEPR